MSHARIWAQFGDPAMPKNVPGQADHAAPKEPLVKRYAKAITAACGLAATLVAAGVLDDTAEAIVTGLLALATTAGVYGVRNAPAKPVA